MAKERIYAFDLLKIFASLAVVLVHISSSRFLQHDVTSFDWQVFNLWDSACRWCVPVFVMVSGALLLNPNKKIDIASMVKKYIPRLLI